MQSAPCMRATLRLTLVAVVSGLWMFVWLGGVVHLASATVEAKSETVVSFGRRLDSLGRRDRDVTVATEQSLIRTDVISGPDIVVSDMSLLSGSAWQATIVVTLTNQGISDTVGPDGTGWFGTDLYIKPAGAPRPTGPGDRYLGACPTPTNYCPATIRWGLYTVTKMFSGTGLAAGETWVLTYTYEFTSGGEYWLYAQADPFWGENGDPDPTLFGSSQSGRIVETDESNNILGPVVAQIEYGRLFLPVVARDYDPTLPPFAIQTYGSLSASNGFDRLVAAGARWVRVPVLWSSVEPYNTTPDQYNWADVDASFQTAALSEVHVIATIDYNPAWAAARESGPVYNPADLQEFVGALVARYPQVEHWEFYNEPDSYTRFGGNGAAYAAMLKSVYPVVKSANPNAKVVMGGLAMDWFQSGFFDPTFLDRVLSNCSGHPCFDIANFHFYPVFRHVWEPHGRDIIGKANYLRQVLAAYGYSRPVICTEASWSSGAQWGSPELQARYVAKLYARSYAADLSVTSWFALTDADISDPGLLGPGLTARPSYTAYQTLTSLMRGARYVRAIPSAETGSPRIEGYEFSVPGTAARKRLDVYWYDCPKMVNPGLLPEDCDDVAPLTINAPRVARIDKLGVAVILYDADDGLMDGRVTLPGGVGSSPIYIDYSP